MIRIRAEHVTWRTVDAEVIVLDRRNWAYLTLNGSGALLWPLMMHDATARDLVARLVDAYAVEQQRAAGDVDAFVEMLRTHDLLE